MRKHYTFDQFFWAYTNRRGFTICTSIGYIEKIIEEGVTPWKFLRKRSVRSIDKAWVLCGLSKPATINKLLKDSIIVQSLNEHPINLLPSETQWEKLYYVFCRLSYQSQYRTIHKLLKKIVELEVGKEEKKR